MLKPIQHPKRAGESYPIKVDFSNRLTGTLEGAAVVSGAASGSTGITVSSVTAVPPGIKFTVAGGTAGQIYDVLVSATLDTGAVLQEVIRVEVS